MDARGNHFPEMQRVTLFISPSRSVYSRGKKKDVEEGSGVEEEVMLRSPRVSGGGAGQLVPRKPEVTG